MSTAVTSSISPHRGERIAVYDESQTLLGEGTFLEKSDMGDIMVYECEEHTILARGEHWIRINTELVKVKTKGEKK